MTALLAAEGLTLGYGQRTLLKDVGFSLFERGLTTLLGPTAGGKSTLLRYLCGPVYRPRTLTASGQVLYGGVPLGAKDYPALVEQRARLLLAPVLENVVHELPERSTLTRAEQRDLAERILLHHRLEQLAENLGRPALELDSGQQRLLAIVRTVARNPRLLCVDEPTANLEDEQDCQSILALLRRVAERRAVLVVTHNQCHARALGGDATLLAGGQLLEWAPVEELLDAPETQAARRIVRTGTCQVPGPDTPPEHLDPTYQAPERARPRPSARLAPVSSAPSDFLGPNGFRWLIPGRLAGTPQPGLIAELEDDLLALRRVQVDVLVNLTEREGDLEACRAYGIELVWRPIVDMQAPTIEAALELGALVRDRLERGQTVALHCKAGLGRTGTMLAAQRILSGLQPHQALREVRSVEPRWVQSEAQQQFLLRLGEALHRVA